MDGGSLDFIGRVPEPIVGRVLKSVLLGIVYLLGLKIMHRDIKPSNILINSAGAIKLCDFGVSAVLTKSLTSTFIGTNAYMAPERVKGVPYTVKSEVWALGLTLVELALGRYPYGDPTKDVNLLTPLELAQYIVHEAPPRLAAGTFRPELIDLCARCMMPQPEHRPTPEGLATHPYFLMYAAIGDGDPELVTWIRSVVQERRAKQAGGAAAAAAAAQAQAQAVQLQQAQAQHVHAQAQAQAAHAQVQAQVQAQHAFAQVQAGTPPGHLPPQLIIDGGPPGQLPPSSLQPMHSPEPGSTFMYM